MASSSSGRHSAPANPVASPARPLQKKRGGIWRVIFWLALIVLIMALVGLGLIFYGYHAANQRYDEISSEYFDEGQSLAGMTVDWDGLRAINPDIVAWIYIPNTGISYPVVQGSDNERYLDTNFDGQTGLASGCGAIFLDAENSPDFSDQNNVIYGHHRNDGTMFAAISNFTDQAYFDEHRQIYLLTPKMNYLLDTFAVVLTVGSDALVETSFGKASEQRAYVQDKIDRSVVIPKEGFPEFEDLENTFMLATCDYTQNDGRAILCAYPVEEAVPDPNAKHLIGGVHDV